MKNFLFTSESVSEGHPDKMADQISDAVLDAILAQDPKGRVACETMLTTGLVAVAGEISTSAKINIPHKATARGEISPTRSSSSSRRTMSNSKNCGTSGKCPSVLP